MTLLRSTDGQKPPRPPGARRKGGRLLALVAVATLCAPALSASPVRPVSLPKPSTPVKSVKPPNRPALYVHVMPWFEAPPRAPGWGWHWTMNHFQPETPDAHGLRPLASHLYPLIGPYDSSDPDALEYHALLMKLAGIDGVIVDWYGTADFNDYALLHRNTQRLLDICRRFRLRFALCYENQAVRRLAEGRSLTPEQALEAGRADLRWLKDHAFNQPLHARWRGQPVLLTFGDPYFTGDQWSALFAAVGVRPALFTQDHARPPAIGVFGWPPMWKAKDGVLTAAALDEYLTALYAPPRETADSALRGEVIGVALPGFHDIYAEAGAHASWGFLDDRGGATLKETLRRAEASRGPFVQVATWNDFGEGTAVEPTRERGYRSLRILRRWKTGDTSPDKDLDARFRLALRLFHLRRRARALSSGAEQTAAMTAAMTALDRAADALANEDLSRAERAMKRVTF